MSIAACCCWRRRRKKRKKIKKQKEKDTFREQVTMDVADKVTDVVHTVVAKTTKEVLLESLPGSFIGSSATSPAPRDRYSSQDHPGSPPANSNKKPRYHTYPSNHSNAVTNPQFLQIHQSISPQHHLSPNYNTGAQQIYDLDQSITFNKSSSYKSPAIVSPNRHPNSFRNSNDSNQRKLNKEQLQYAIYGDEDIPEIPTSTKRKHRESAPYIVDDKSVGVASVNYEDAEVDEKENKLRKSNVSVPIKQYYDQPDVFPEDMEENEGYDNTQPVPLVANNGLYNSSSDLIDEDEKNDHVHMPSDSIEIEMQHHRRTSNDYPRHKNEVSMIESISNVPYSVQSHPLQNRIESPVLQSISKDSGKFFMRQPNERKDKMNMNMIEKIMLDQASTVADENDDEIGPLQSVTSNKYNKFPSEQCLSPVVAIDGILKRKSRSSGTAEMSQRSGKSFITIKDESKQIEVSSNEFVDDDDDDLDDVTSDDNPKERTPLLSDQDQNEEDDAMDEDDDFDFDDVSNRKYSDYMKNKVKHKNLRTKMVSVPSESGISSQVSIDQFKNITAY